MDYRIDNNDIEGSFDRIARKLLTECVLKVNDTNFEITEIEFYYFFPGVHEDKYTHPHTFEAGKWRYHNQGLDITLQGSDIQDGGILIRGIKSGDMYVNGPLKVVQKIYETFAQCTDDNHIILLEVPQNGKKLLKTFRHIPNKVSYPEFHHMYYRYLTDLDSLDIPANEKSLIRENNKFL